MAAVDLATQPSDRHSRRRPFTSWVKRLTNLKSSDPPNSKKGGYTSQTKMKKMTNAIKNNPYPESGHLNQPSETFSTNGHLSFSTRVSQPNNGSLMSIPTSAGTNGLLADSNRSAAPTVATNPETVHSDAGHSKAFTATTGNGALSSVDGAGHNSTFSSPNQSVQSLATTLTTIQSTSPGNALGPTVAPSSANGHAHPSTGLAPSSSFSHQYPVSPTPASAIPPYLAPSGNPMTYSGATANNLLTDDASILTLASSSKRRKRRSMDTDASVRALAPSSVWGGSRESLPLSVLSGNADHGMSNNLWAPNQTRPSLSGGLASTERASVYSSHSVAAPVLASERNSYYAGSHKPSIKDNKDKDKDKDSRSIDGRSMHRGDAGDGRSVNFDGKSLYGNESLKGYEGSIRSGALGHGRNDSLPGSNSSPLASPLPVTGSQRGLLSSSRRNSDRLEMEEEAVDERGEWESGEQMEQDHKV